ncbi:hypothetical protein B0T24DRAFT_85181 [Lasiosphaeria ovina]|uniref:Zn(2)-C6 fungal-type domain-containing protein n=1 Tax=Lasiosphaeria ovina TaxID=92902 RepID=A0AAE0TYP4_9PEZI|nr:hypothetical protein B0T24DRAFT_85181 [Lasiosphaeria ovina]
MMRRRHKKSRRGCLECKRRHIKCDETRPRCINCATVERDCSFPPTSEGGESVVSPSTRTSPSGSISGLHPDAVFTELPRFSPLAELHPRVDMVHMELLHHYLTEEGTIFPPMVGMPLAITMRHALREPYLMYQVLALSAHHLSILRPLQEQFYRNTAIQLQTHAVTLFNNIDLGYFDSSFTNRIPVFIFSSVLGFHTLCDTLSHRDDYFPTSLARFMRCLHLHRGVHNSTAGHWEDIQGSELKPVIDAGLEWYNVRGVGPECDDIQQRILSSSLNPQELEATQEALDLLQAVFDGRPAVFDGRPSSVTRIHALFNWTTMLVPSFVSMLDAGRPEALAVLGYYFLALHHCRDAWMVGDSGQFLLRSVADYLGPDWSAWMEPPLQMLNELSAESATSSPSGIRQYPHHTQSIASY